MAKFGSVKLGKRHPRFDPRIPMLARFTAKLPPPPPTATDYASKVPSWPMMANDKLGDCTCAAVGHCIEQWTTYNGNPVVMPDPDVISLYEQVGGYNPANPNTDQGAVEVDVLNYWLNNPVAGLKPLQAYASLELQNHNEVMDAVYWFGNCYIGLALPISAQNQDIWAVPPAGAVGEGAPGSWGGHAVPVVAYDGRGLTVVTWGTTQRMTWQFWDTYCDEAYALLSDAWVSGGKNPAGMDTQQLIADMQSIKNGFASAKAIKHI